MLRYGRSSATGVPDTLEKRLEVMQAIRALAMQEDEQLRKRRADIAGLRRELELLRDSLPELVRQSIDEGRRECGPLLRSYAQKFSPDQPRVPAGNPDGGQWTKEGESGASSALPRLSDDRVDAIPDNGQPYAAPTNDSRVISDAAPDNNWIPGAQYAANDGEGEGTANDNRTPDEVCQQAYSEGMARLRMNPSLSSEDYLDARYQLASALQLCLELANGVRPVSRNGNFIEFWGDGIVIFRQGRSPLYIPRPGSQ